MEVPAFLQRLYTERDELTDKHQNLLKFLENLDNIKITGEVQWVLLAEQFVYMSNYLRLLNSRIDLIEEATQ